jgi:hypothetical protein
MRQATEKVTTFGRTAGATGSAMSGFTRRMGQVSLQAQDVAVQLSMGTSAMRVFGQQAPQILGAFGPVGAAIGVAAAALPLLAAGFFDTTDAAKEFEGTAKTLQTALTGLKDAGFEVATSTQLFGAALKSISQTTARASIETMRTQLKDLTADAKEVSVSLSAREFSDAVPTVTTITAGWQKLGETLQLGDEHAKMLRAALDEVAGAPIENLQRAAQDALNIIANITAETGQALSPAMQQVKETIEASGLAAATLADNTVGATSETTKLAGAWQEVLANAQGAMMAAGQVLAAQARAQAGMAAINNTRPTSFGGALGARPSDFPLSGIPNDAIRQANAAFPVSTLTGSPAAAGGRGGGGAKSGLAKLDEDAKLVQQSVKDAHKELDRLDKEALRDLERSADRMGDTFSDAFLGAIDGSKSLQESLADLAGDLASMFVSAGFSGLAKGTGFAALLQGIMPAYAGGTQFARGGLSLVGERGPELVSLPRGSKVTPNASLGGNVFTFAPVIDARGADSAAVARAMTAQAAQFEDFKRSMPDRVAHIRRDPRYKG